ncbi:interferon-induced protein 44-like isoform X2 [Xyrauchen texanus]|uniref:interferon-induced protein 44-like isoform X2 n=1 Tax=Xyrauchen texanus TaxID=154827 RepID=UPI0022420720|nr:interferon-induced protein 44-like isoform X2 [Xyrauchen texanus]
MGGAESKPLSPPSRPSPPSPPPSPPKPPPEYAAPWRTTPWEDREHLKKTLMEFQLSNPNVKYVRILVIGEVGAGKSSFINSVNSVFQERITTEALADATSGTSFTKIYRTFNIRSGQSVLPFVFNDIMGLEAKESLGTQPDDIVKALKGLLKEGYKFNPANPVSDGDEGFRCDPEVHEQTFCLVYIMAADKVSRQNLKVIEKMVHIRKKASELDIPQVIIMTRVDEICPLVKGNVRKIYTSKKIKTKMEECSILIGVPMSHIFPVKNYHEEIDTASDIDVLLLRALTQIVQIANDKLRNVQ